MITGLNHINLRAPAELLAVLRDFYRDVLGLTVGPRPGFDSDGYWLYAGGHAIVHLSTQRAGETRHGGVTALCTKYYEVFRTQLWLALDSAAEKSTNDCVLALPLSPRFSSELFRA